MDETKITLITDGSSDKSLVYVIEWLWDDLFPTRPKQVEFADFRGLPSPPEKANIEAQISKARTYYPFDIIIYHRDAEKTDLKILNQRKLEIKGKINERYQDIVVCLIPVKMMETWLLIDPEAIKKAAGNRMYSGKMDLPTISKLEREQKPKEKLHSLLKQVSGLKKRRLENFNTHQAIHLVAENIKDYSALRKLESFRQFEADLKIAVEKLTTLSIDQKRST